MIRPPRSLPPLATLLATVLALAACGGAADGSADGAPADSAAAATGDSAAPLATAPVAERCRTETTVAGDGIGPARLGSSLAELARLCGGRDTTFTLGEGITEQGSVVSLGGGSVVALAGNDTIRRLIVREPGLTTAGGLGVGATLADVRRAYPQACALVGEGLIVVAADALPGVSFATSADYGRFAGTGSPQMASLPDTARVVTLWVHGVGRPCGEANRE